jgi:hypothetical protein
LSDAFDRAMKMNERLLAERDALSRRIADLERDRDGERGMISMTIARLGGTVEGHPTDRHNFLQRIDELRAIEAADWDTRGNKERRHPIQRPPFR